MRAMRRVSSDRTKKPQGETMLKKIALIGIFALSTAFVTATAVSAHSAATIAKSVPIPTAPQGLCKPMGTSC
jgi:hypothetical protein